MNRMVQVYLLLCCVQIFSWRVLVHSLAIEEEYPVPVAFYPLNEHYGTRDISKNHLPSGTAFNVTLDVGPDGKEKGSYYFHGNQFSYIDIPKHPKLDTKNSMSILMWIYNKGTHGPVLLYDTGVIAWGVHIFIHLHAGTSLFYVSPISRNNAFDGHVKTFSQNIATNGWNFVGYTYDIEHGIQRIYVDGVMTNMSTPKYELNTNFKIKLGGVKLGSYGSFTGRLSCLQIYDKALTAAQVQTAQMYCKTFGLLSSVYKPCFVYHSTSQSNRAPNDQISGQPSDRNTFSLIHWYRMRGNNNVLRIASSCPKAGSCGTQSPGWLNGKYPSREAGITKMEICYRDGSNCCGFKGYVFVKKCFGYYVFKFDDLPTVGRFCTEEIPNDAHDVTFMSTNEKCLSNHVFYTETDVTEVSRCMGYCLSAGTACKSFNFLNEGDGKCQLNSATMTTDSLSVNSTCSYYEPV